MVESVWREFKWRKPTTTTASVAEDVVGVVFSSEEQQQLPSQQQQYRREGEELAAPKPGGWGNGEKKSSNNNSTTVLQDQSSQCSSFLSATAREFIFEKPINGVNGSVDDTVPPLGGNICEETAEIIEEVGGQGFEDFEHVMVEALQLSSPDCSLESICSALRCAEFNFKVASRLILKAAEAKESDVRPCRYLLNGGCYRHDCAFSHSFDSVVCKFWLHEGCLAADNCFFLHDFVLSNVEGREEEEDDELYHHNLNEEATSSPTHLSCTPLDFPALPAVEIEKDEQPRTRLLRGADTEVAPISPAMSFAAAAPKMPSCSTTWTNKEALGSQPQFAETALINNSSRGYHQCSQAAPVTVSMSTTGMNWVSGGQESSQQYAKARSEAAVLAKERNKLFMAAINAFRRGDGATAKHLSQKGHEINTSMKEKHRMAAECIVLARNGSLMNIIARGCLDLHGLHVAEAVAFLDVLFPQLIEERVPRIQIITGAGHHSKGSNFRCRLLPAVKRYFNEAGYYSYQEVKDKNGHIGAIILQLTG